MKDNCKFCKTKTDHDIKDGKFICTKCGKWRDVPVITTKWMDVKNPSTGKWEKIGLIKK